MVILVVKLYAWEIPMMNLIKGIRKLELRYLFKANFIKSIVDVFNISSPFIVSKSINLNLNFLGSNFFFYNLFTFGFGTYFNSTNCICFINFV